MKRLLVLALAMGLTFLFGLGGCGVGGGSSGGGGGSSGGVAWPVFPWPVWPENGNATLAFEDWGIGASDYDYNDFITDVSVVATYSQEDIDQLELRFEAQARGSGYQHDLHLLIPAGIIGSDGVYTIVLYETDGTELSSTTDSFTESTDLDLEIFGNTWDAQPEWNTLDGSGVGPGRVTEVFLDFDTPFPLPEGVDLPGDPGDPLFFDVYLHVWDTDEDIHFTDPRLIVAPVDWEWPQEEAAIWTVYPYNSTSDEGVIGGDPPSFTTYWYTETPTDYKWTP